jgi:hypothetical protein
MEESSNLIFFLWIPNKQKKKERRKKGRKEGKEREKNGSSSLWNQILFKICGLRK